MSVREKQLYGIIIALAVALGSLSGYLVALFQQGQRVQYGASPEYGETKLYPIVVGGEQETQLRTIAVTGLGRASAKPNKVEMMMGAKTQGATATESLGKNAESMNKVIEALKRMDIPEKDIETTSFYIYPRYSSYDGGTIIGFEVAHMLRVTTTNLDKVGEIIDKAVEAGANWVEGIYFTFTKDKIEELNTLARQRAVDDARAKAETIAKSLEFKIIGVASATEETGYYPYYDSWRSYSFMYPVPMPTPPQIMPPTEVEVTVTIRVTYIIE